MDGNISFNAISLQTYTLVNDFGIIVNTINHTDIPEKQAAIFSVANADRSNIPNINYTSKKISISGALKHTSQSALDTLIDTFKGYFNRKDANLDIVYGSSTRRYIATANALSIDRDNRSLTAKFKVEFVCTNPFGIETTVTSIINQINYTAATLTVTPTILGSAPTQMPTFTITIDAKTGAGDFISISNNNNNQQISLIGLALLVNDVIVIDCENRTVTVNGNPVNYFGTFLELELNANSITYSDGYDTRTVDIVAGYNKRYL